MSKKIEKYLKDLGVQYWKNIVQGHKQLKDFVMVVKTCIRVIDTGKRRRQVQ